MHHLYISNSFVFFVVSDLLLYLHHSVLERGLRIVLRGLLPVLVQLYLIDHVLCVSGYAAVKELVVLQALLDPLIHLLQLVQLQDYSVNLLLVLVLDRRKVLLRLLPRFLRLLPFVLQVDLLELVPDDRHRERQQQHSEYQGDCPDELPQH